MRPFSEIKSCLDVTDEDIRAVLAPARSLIEPGPRDRTLALINHMARIATPWRGAPKVLIVLAHMATRDWLEGDLCVKIIGDDDVSVIEGFVDDGFTRSRLFGPFPIDAAFREFRAALLMHAQMVLPLAVEGVVEARRVELRTSQALRSNTIPPAYSAVSASLLPVVGGANRILPEIISRPPPSAPGSNGVASSALSVPEPVESTITDEPGSRALVRQRFKPMSLPPHMKDALASRKKKV